MLLQMALSPDVSQRVAWYEGMSTAALILGSIATLVGLFLFLSTFSNRPSSQETS
jgi:hypothetical protein